MPAPEMTAQPLADEETPTDAAAQVSESVDGNEPEQADGSEAEVSAVAEETAPDEPVAPEAGLDEAPAEDESAAPEPPPAAPEETPAAPNRPKAAPVSSSASETQSAEGGEMNWYILKVAFNREDSIADALRKRVKMEGMDEFFGEIVVPTEDVATFTRDGKRRISKRKLLPGYIMVNMLINDDTWFLVRETGGISDFTGAAGKPMPMEPADIERFVMKPETDDEEEEKIKIGIPFKVGDRVRVKEGNFENQEGDVDAVDEANGRITVIINIFGRSVPMELDHWQVEPLD